MVAARPEAMTIALLVLVVVLGGCDFIRSTQRSFIFPREGIEQREHAAEAIEGFERLYIDVEGGRVEAWYLPPIGPRERPAPAVIVAHGNASVIDHWPARVDAYRRMGLAVLLPEYRGYGRSAGTPSEAAIVADCERFYDLLVERDDIDGARVAMHGVSLGGGVVAALSSRRSARALVLESTFTNVPDLASQWLAPATFIEDRFDTRAVLSRASTPVLILHGTEDTVVPFKHARELHRVAWDSRLVPFRAGHRIPQTERGYWSRIRAFLREAGVLSTE